MNFISETEKVSIVTFTVEMAEEIISKSLPEDNYRSPKTNIVNMYAKDMEEGKWMFCGDCIRFDKNGKLIDGQHRLRAIIKSKKPQKFVVIEGLEVNSALVMDIGHKRSIEDYLKKQADAYEKGATAIVKQVMTFKKEDKCIGHSAGNIDARNTKVVELYSQDEDWYNKAAKYSKEVSKDSARILKPTEVGAIYYYLIRVLNVDKDKVEDFFFRLCNAKRNDKTIYNTTITNLGDKEYIKRSGVKRTDEYIECWNAMLHNCTVKRQHYSDWFENPNDSVQKEELEAAMAEA